jgi:4'-phosphopantetheinyl transferase
MIRANIQIVICPLSRISAPKEIILSLGTEFARKYHLPIPHQVVTRPRQKPHFDCDGIYYSISHSGDYWACGLSDTPLGIDLQRHQPCRQARIAGRFFHPAEVDWLASRPDDAFFQIWTAKESYVKFTGEGITDQFSCFSVVNPDGGIDCCRNGYFQFLPFQDGFTFCVCSAKPAQITLIQQ